MKEDYGQFMSTPEGQKIIRTAYKTVFESDNGRMVLRDLRYWFSQGTTLKPSAFAPDPVATLACESKRYVVLHIEGMMEEDDGGGSSTVSDPELD